jgi:hypothetical protein
MLMKTRIKTAIISSMAVVAAFISLTSTTSCNRDKCKTIVCAHNGVCDGGICLCPAGYEGSNCETVSRDKFLGNWTVFEKGSVTNSAQYGVTIGPAADISHISITNFYNYFRTAVDGYIVRDTMYIPNQQYEGKLIFGIGYIYADVTYKQNAAILLRYEVIDTATQLVNDFGYNSVINASNPSMWNK